jgi:hypothetical protein
MAVSTQVTGEVARPGDSGYEAARIGFSRLFDRKVLDIEPGEVAAVEVAAVELDRHVTD